MLQNVSFFVDKVIILLIMKNIYKIYYLSCKILNEEGIDMKKNNLKGRIAKNVCSFLSGLAYTASSSYSFVGPYEPQKPTQLQKKVSSKTNL